MKTIILSVLTVLVINAGARAQFIEATRVATSNMQHQEWITQVVVTPSGKEFVSGGVDGRIAFWDAATGKLNRELALTAPVLALSVTRDGNVLAAGDASGNVSVIDVATAKVKATFKADKNIVNAVAASDDGKAIASGGADGVVRIASIDGKILNEISPTQGSVVALAFAKEHLVVGLRGKDKRSADLWDWQNKRLIRTFDEGPAGMRAISVSPDGQLLAIADHVQATLLSMIPTDNGGAELSLRVLPDTDEGTLVAIWDVASGKRTALINGETGARSLAFSPDGQMLATAGANGVVIHDIGSRMFTEVGRIDSRASVDAVAFTPDSKRLVLAREREPMVTSDAGGTNKLVDPFFTSIVMQVRQGLNSGVMATMGATMRDAPAKNASSATGGAIIEVWNLDRRTSPGDIRTWEAVQAYFTGKTEEARRLLEKTVKDSPNSGEAQRLAAVLFEGKDPKRMQSLLEAAVKADPNCVPCWRSLGDLQYQTEQFVEAIKSYDNALKLRPEYGLVAGHQAEAYAALGLRIMSSENTEKTMDAAKQVMTSAIKLRPGVALFYTNLASAYYFRGDFDTNISLLMLARRLRPDHARIYYNLGHAYRNKGEKQKAIEAYRQYIQMGEKGEEARVERAKEFIKELSK